MWAERKIFEVKPGGTSGNYSALQISAL